MKRRERLYPQNAKAGARPALFSPAPHPSRPRGGGAGGRRQRIMGGRAEPPLLVGTVLQEWLEGEKNNLKLSSYQKYRGILQNHILPQLGGLPVRQVSEEDIAKLVKNRLSVGGLPGGLSRGSLNGVLIVLSMGLRYAKRAYRVDCPPVHLLRTEKYPAKAFSVPEQELLLRHFLSKKELDGFGIIMGLYTGLRIGELCALRWEDISDSTISVNKTMQRLKNAAGRTEVMILPPKTAASNRVIPIPTRLKPLVEAFRQKSGYVIALPSGKYMEPRLLQLRFARFLKECGLGKNNFHTLRHTFATRCIEAGVDIKTLSELLGHSDVKTTMNRYVHSSFLLKQQSMDRLLPTALF